MEIKITRTKTFLIFALLGILLLALGCDGDDSLSSEFANVSGTITFENVAMWPDSGIVMVTLWQGGVWTAFGPINAQGPPAGVDTLQKVAGQTQYTYQFDGMSPGDYSAIAVGWEHPDETRDRSVRVATLGVYWGDADSVSVGLNIPGSPFDDPTPAAFKLEKGDNITNFDFKADFFNIVFLGPATVK
ncbi:MAG: hypothetical protein ACE5HS_16690 [bacterium]